MGGEPAAWMTSTPDLLAGFGSRDTRRRGIADTHLAGDHFKKGTPRARSSAGKDGAPSRSYIWLKPCQIHKPAITTISSPDAMPNSRTNG